MDDPKRLAEVIMDDFEAELLRAARSDAMPAQSRHAILSGLGVALPLLLDPGASYAGPTAPSGSVPNAVAPETASAPSATGTGLPPLSGEGPLLNAGAAQAGSGAGLAKTLLLGAGVSSIGAAAIWATVQWSSPAPVASSLPVASDAVVDRPTADVQATEPHAPPQTDESARPLPSEEPLDESPLELDAPPAERPTSPTLRRRTPGSPERTAQATSPAADSLSDELQAIEAARRSLAANDASETLRLLQRYDQRFPRGSLRTERTVLMIEALVKKGERARASRLGESFLERSPNGPYAQRIRSLLNLPPNP